VKKNSNLATSHIPNPHLPLNQLPLGDLLQLTTGIHALLNLKGLLGAESQGGFVASTLSLASNPILVSVEPMLVRR